MVTIVESSEYEGDLRRAAADLAEVERLNFGNQGFSQWQILGELCDQRGSAVLLLADGKVVGYTASTTASYAYSLDWHYHDRDPEGAAYITNSSIHPDYQHQGHIWSMMEIFEGVLRSKGFKFLDRDSRNDVGYADKVITRYGDRVVFAKPDEVTMWGLQRYIRVRL